MSDLWCPPAFPEPQRARAVHPDQWLTPPHLWTASKPHRNLTETPGSHRLYGGEPSEQSSAAHEALEDMMEAAA